MKILIAKEYVIAFESGVIVIRDWFVHNQFRHDRYTPTAHMEKSLLVLNKDKTYQLMPSDVHPSGNQRLPQVRLGKVSIGKYSIDKYRVGEGREQSDDVAATPCHEILSLYHALCPSFRPAKVLTSRRIAAMEALYATPGKSMEAIKGYASVPDLLRDIRDSFNTGRTAEILRSVQRAPALCWTIWERSG